MGKRRGLIETLEEFFDEASADAAELITKQVVKMNKLNQGRHGKLKAVKRKPKQRPEEKPEERVAVA